MARLEIPKNSRTGVKQFLQQLDSNARHDPSSKRNRKCIIDEFSEDARIVYHCLETGMSVTMTTFMLNTWRRSVNKRSVSWSAVENFCRQLRDMFEAASALNPSPHNFNFPALSLHMIAWWDEKHSQCIIGPNGKYETLIARNTFDNAVTSPQFGGIFPPSKQNISVKFATEARGEFGCAMIQLPDGTFEGRKSRVFDYSSIIRR